MHAISCRVASATAALFGHPFMVLALTIGSIGTLAWWLVSPTQLAGGIFLSVLALQVTAGVQWSGTNDTRELKRALAEIVRAVPDADDGAAPGE